MTREMHFNTGRQYAEDGQRISLRIEDDRVAFEDHTRMISGAVELSSFASKLSDEAIRDLVMSRYDRGEYQQTNDRIEWKG